MARVREIKRHITSVNKIKQITKAMYAISMTRVHKAKTQLIKARAYADAQVEPGPLSLEIRELEKRQFTAANLTAVLGRERVECLKDQIQPVLQRQIWIHGATHKPSADDYDGLL